MAHKSMFYVGALSFLLLLSPVCAWWNDTNYGFRYEIMSNSSLELPIFINGSYNRPYYWTSNTTSGDNIYLYCSVSGCQSGLLAIGNDTTQKYWENDTSRLGYLPESLWDSYPVHAVWHLNNDSGTVYDSSSNSYDCSVQDSPTQVMGRWDRGLSFDGTNDYLDCGASFRTITTTYSITGWLLVHTTGVTPRVVADVNLADTNGGRQLYSTSTEFGFQTYDGAINTITGCDGHLANRWYHVVGVQNNTGIYLYVNGSFCAWKNGAGTGVSTINFRIGSRQRDNLFGNQTLDEIRFWNKALNETEIFYLWQSRANISSIEQAVPTTTTTLPLLEEFDYCQLLWAEQNIQVKANHNWCIDNETIARNVTFQIIVDGNATEIVTYSTERCPNGCDNVTNACIPEQFDITMWLIIIGVIIIMIGAWIGTKRG